MKPTSRIPGLFNLSPSKRIEKVMENSELNEEDAKIVSNGLFIVSELDKMIENYIGPSLIPMGVATNFVVDGNEVIIPMATEEPSVIAACSLAAKICRETGGFSTFAPEFSAAAGQIFLEVDESEDNQKVDRIVSKIKENKEKILSIANETYGKNRRSKAIDLMLYESHRVVSGQIRLVLLLIANVGDAFGANVINTMCEGIAPFLEELTESNAILKIVTNLSIFRVFEATAIWSSDALKSSFGSIGANWDGKDIANAIVRTAEIAENDPFRAATHIKGIMNGIDALALATGNDTRAIESAAFSFANFDFSNFQSTVLLDIDSKTRQDLGLDRFGTNCSKALSKFTVSENGDLKGFIRLPLPFATYGGSMRSNKTTLAALKILGTNSARKLSRIAASVGLAQNFAALRALSIEGIQKGHMRLHSRKYQPKIKEDNEIGDEEANIRD